MSRNVLVTIVVVILIALAGGYYFMNKNQNSIPANNDSAVPASSEQPVMEKGSLKNFMSMAGNQQCTFSDTETGNSGTVFIAQGKTRGDFSSKVGDKITPTHMINDGRDIYIWMDDQTTGFKTSINEIEQMSNTEGMTGVNQTVDINKQVDYKCDNWSVDDLKFVVPAEIKFQDMGAMIKNLQNMRSAMPSVSASGGSAEACKACENLDGNAQVQCKSALKCN